MSGLSGMQRYAQFVNYAVVGKSKFPCDATGRKIDPHDQRNQVTLSEALQRMNAGGNKIGVAFVFRGDDPFFFIDIDGCIDPPTGRITPLAEALCARFAGAAVETSVSGTGLHIIGSCTKPIEHGCKNKEYGLELYTSGRIVALTGNNLYGDVTTNCDEALRKHIEIYHTRKEEAGVVAEWGSGPHPDWAGHTDDQELIAHALNSGGGANSAFGLNSATFRDLWQKNVEALSRAYPDNFGGERAYDESSADAALFQHLAYWTGNDAARMLRLAELSGLKRDKWVAHRSYLKMTIDNATARQTTFHRMTPIAEDGTDVERLSGSPILAIDQQMGHFKGCVYVCDEHKVLTPKGHLLKPDQFNVMYGGYMFILDYGNSKATPNAFTAFTQSRAARFPKADTTFFAPLKETGLIRVERNGSTSANVWADPKVRTMEGDPAPFLEHLKKLLPQDWEIPLQFMAAVVQFQGVKFQWAPFIQGVQGNGKTTLSRCVKYAVGDAYAYFPRAGDLAERFNDYLENRVFIGIEDMYIHKGRLYVADALKPIITATVDDGYEIEGKGKNKKNIPLYCNFILNANDKSAVAKTADDRRYAPFYCAQQTPEDIIRDGMGGDYFANLYRWFKKDGFAIVAHFLRAYPLPSDWVDRVGCHRAPMTTSTAEAVSLSAGNVEQEVKEAIGSGMIGFRGGWVSSMALDNLLDQYKLSYKVPRNKRRALLKSLGYDYHPALVDGRSTRVTTADNGRPRLFVDVTNFDLMSITDRHQAVDAYEKAQAEGV